MKKTLTLIPAIFFGLLLAGNFATEPAGKSAKEPTTRARPEDAPLAFLSDLPELKGVTLEMSEKEFLKIIAGKKLGNERSEDKSGTSYHVRIPWKDMDALVYFGFRGGKCTGIQRLQPEPKEIAPAAAK